MSSNSIILKTDFVKGKARVLINSLCLPGLGLGKYNKTSEPKQAFYPFYHFNVLRKTSPTKIVHNNHSFFLFLFLYLEIS